MPPTPPGQAIRRWALTLGVAGITVTGTIYGAGLKMRKEADAERDRQAQASPEQHIEELLVTREGLVRKKEELEQRMRVFRRRKAEREVEAERLRLEQERVAAMAGKRAG